MFTGIVQCIGRVVTAEANPFGVRLTVRYPADGLRPVPGPGDSVAVNGCCLTHAPADAADRQPGRLAFDVIRETLHKTTLGHLKPDDAVNLEPSLTANTPIGGHFVQGHIDATGVITELRRGDDEVRLTIQTPPALTDLIVPKGSIAVDGVSLTIASIDSPENRFTVALIPTTLKLTTLGDAAAGRSVNLEADMLVKTVAHLLRARDHSGPGN